MNKPTEQEIINEIYNATKLAYEIIAERMKMSEKEIYSRIYDVAAEIYDFLIENGDPPVPKGKLLGILDFLEIIKKELVPETVICIPLKVVSDEE